MPGFWFLFEYSSICARCVLAAPEYRVRRDGCLSVSYLPAFHSICTYGVDLYLDSMGFVFHQPHSSPSTVRVLFAMCQLHAVSNRGHLLPLHFLTFYTVAASPPFPTWPAGLRTRPVARLQVVEVSPYDVENKSGSKTLLQNKTRQGVDECRESSRVCS